MKAFFDTNILIYTATSDAKRQQAVDCLSRGGVASVQVLNEFAHVARRKLRHEWPQIELALGLFHTAFDDVLPITLHTHRQSVSRKRCVNAGGTPWSGQLICPRRAIPACAQSRMTFLRIFRIMLQKPNSPAESTLFLIYRKRLDRHPKSVVCCQPSRLDKRGARDRHETWGGMRWTWRCR